MKKFDKSEKGFGILEILIASSLLLLMFSFLSNRFVNLSRYSDKKKNDIGFLMLKTYINERADCGKTQDANGDSCTDNTSLEILAADDSIIISRDSITSVGPSYQVRAVCKGGDIDILARKVRNGNPVRDPLKRRVVGNNGWISLYKKIPFHCSLL
ncbi:MAG: hypothetical protein HRU19_33015 [Pseudobacteriovorax sp.]|nr:hypothetical protein [Pseudobacteriovorax sp.]